MSSDQLALFDIAPPHTCHYDGCNHRIDKKYLMCGFHWRMVPKDIQDAVYRQYTQGQEDNHGLIKPGYWAAANLAKVAVRSHLAGVALESEPDHNVSSFRKGDFYRVIRQAFPFHGQLVEVVAAEGGRVFAKPVDTPSDAGYLFPPLALDHHSCGFKALARVEWVKRPDRWDYAGFCEKARNADGYLFVEGYNPNLETWLNPPDPQAQVVEVQPTPDPAVEVAGVETQPQPEIEANLEEESAGVSDQAATLTIDDINPGDILVAIAGAPFEGQRVKVGHIVPFLGAIYAKPVKWPGVSNYPYNIDQLAAGDPVDNPFNPGDLVIVKKGEAKVDPPLAGDVCVVTQVDGATVHAKSTHNTADGHIFPFDIEDLIMLAPAKKDV